MAQKKLSGQQFVDFLKANPAYQNISIDTGSQQSLMNALGEGGIQARQDMFGRLAAAEEARRKKEKGPGGILGVGLGIAKGIADPFIRSAKVGAELGNLISHVGQGEDYQKMFFDITNPKDALGEFGKLGLSTAAFAVPGGASTYLGAGFRGAGGAGLSSASNQLDLDKENFGIDAKRLATDSLMGGAFGAGTKYLGNQLGKSKTRGDLKTLNSIDDKQDRLKDYLVKGSPAKDSQGFAKLSGNRMQRLSKDVQLDTMGIKGSPKDFNYYSNTRKLKADMSDMLDVLGAKPTQKGQQLLKNEIGKAKGDLIANSGYGGINVEDFTRDMTRNVMLDGGENITRQDVANKFAKIAGDFLDREGDTLSSFSQGASTLNPGQMDKIRQGIGPYARRAYNRIANGTSKDNDYLISAIDTSLKKDLSKNVPGYLRANTMLATLDARTPTMSGAFNQGNSVSNLGQQNLVSQMTSFAKNKVIGPGLQLAGDLPGNIKNFNIPNMNIPAPIAKMAANPLLQQIGPAAMTNIRSNLQGQEQGGGGVDPLEYLQGNMEGGQPQLDGSAMQSGGMENPQMGMGGGGQPDKMQIFQAALADTGNVNTAMKLAEFLGEQGGGGSRHMPQRVIDGMIDAESALDSLDLLEDTVRKNGKYMGPVQGGLLGNLAQRVGLGGNRAESRTLLSSIGQSLAKNLEGGKLTDDDRRFYREEALPSLSDTPQNALRKIEALRERATQQLGNVQKGYTGAYGDNEFLNMY